MALLLAYGEKADQSGADWVLILVGAGILVVAAVLAGIPIGMAGRARSSRKELVLAGAILWAVVSAASAISAVSAQFKWAHERDLLIQSGYYDPATKNDAPAKPWAWWAVLGAAYPVLLVLSLSRATPAPGTGPAETPRPAAGSGGMDSAPR